MVLYHLAKMAGVKFKAHMQVTTIDPPELMQFVRANYPDVVLHRPTINFYDLIVKNRQEQEPSHFWASEQQKVPAGQHATS